MNTVSKKAGILAAAALLALAPWTVLAQVSPGTELNGEIDRTLSSKDSQVGQVFKLTNVHSSAHEINGAVVYGHISEVQSAGQGRPGKIELAVDKINTRMGNIYNVTGYTTNVKVNTKSNAGKEAAAAAGAALLGGLIAGGWGAVIGGTGGFLVAKNSRENVTVPAGSLVTVHVTTSRKQASHM